MAASRYAQPAVNANPSPESFNRLASKRLLEDDSLEAMQYSGSPANKRIRHEASSVSGAGVPRIKSEPPHTDLPPMQRAHEDDIIAICKTSTKVNLTAYELEKLTEIQTKIDWVFNNGAKFFDILCEIKNIPHNPPTSYGITLKPEQNRCISLLQKRMKDAQTRLAAQSVKAELGSSPKKRKIKKCRGRNAKSPSLPAQQVLPVENVMGMLKLNDESAPAVVQIANYLLASKNLKLVMSGGELRLVDVAIQS
jgi:hypothetical protein